MAFTKNSPEWRTIIENSEHFFSPETMRFWGSRVAWTTLKRLPSGFGFITSEHNFDRTERLYTVRVWTPERGVSTLDFQEHTTLSSAKTALSHY